MKRLKQAYVQEFFYKGRQGINKCRHTNDKYSEEIFFFGTNIFIYCNKKKEAKKVYHRE